VFTITSLNQDRKSDTSVDTSVNLGLVNLGSELEITDATNSPKSTVPFDTQSLHEDGYVESERQQAMVGALQNFVGIMCGSIDSKLKEAMGKYSPPSSGLCLSDESLDCMRSQLRREVASNMGGLLTQLSCTVDEVVHTVCESRMSQCILEQVPPILEHKVRPMQEADLP